MMARVPLGVLLLLLAPPLGAQGKGPSLDFLDERVPIPESALYDSAEYGAGGAAAFAQARNAYDHGHYPQATLSFAQLSNDHPHKSAVWVYLARAFFHGGDFPSARQALQRAGQLMPELEEPLWQPLGRGLEEEVKRLAFQLQAQADYYPKRQGDWLPLLRLYRFLGDSTQALALVEGAARRRAELLSQAQAAAGAQRQALLGAAAQWEGLLGQLWAEGGGAPADSGQGVNPDSVKEAETLRLLKLRVEYYLAKPKEYQQLFEGYLRLARRAEAGAVVEALEQEVQRLGLLEAVAPTPGAAAKFAEQAAALRTLGQGLRTRLEAVPPP